MKNRFFWRLWNTLYPFQLDPTWTIEVIGVHLGPLAEVSVGWSPRGSGGVEYLVSWVEESGSVSGHLLTDQVMSELSLWPGQAYYIQVGFVLLAVSLSHIANVKGFR